MNVQALLAQAMLDPFFGRVFQHVLDQVRSDSALAGYAAKPPEELVAIALGNWMTGMLHGGRPPVPAEATADDDPPPERSIEEDEFVERDSLLAAAVGACDCWGERADCPFCEGDGSAGWIRPDKQLFTTYVYPAVRAMQAAPPAAAPTTTAQQTNGSHRKENGHG